MKSPNSADSHIGPIRRNAAPVLGSDLVVFSHLRWDFVFQRPHHLMTRMARHRRVFFVEEPQWGRRLDVEVLPREAGVTLVVPHLANGTPKIEAERQLEALLRRVFDRARIRDFTAWYYTPMALPFSRYFTASAVVYDAMDELSLFKGAPAELPELEKELFRLADVVFTGGHALFEAKQGQHVNIHPVPSSIDLAHFRKARTWQGEPRDQAEIPRKRVGFFGVLDERLDVKLLADLADLRPDWQLIMIGPVVKIDPAVLPRRKNIHYLGKKDYAELPGYLAGWDLAILPFARNESTRFISPTKTPEYLAAGCPVVSTPITDVVRPYGQQGFVQIAENAEQFSAKGEVAMADAATEKWRTQVEGFLSQNSWETTYLRMAELERTALEAKQTARALLDAAAKDTRRRA